MANITLEVMQMYVWSTVAVAKQTGLQFKIGSSYYLINLFFSSTGYYWELFILLQITWINRCITNFYTKEHRSKNWGLWNTMCLLQVPLELQWCFGDDDCGTWSWHSFIFLFSTHHYRAWTSYTRRLSAEFLIQVPALPAACFCWGNKVSTALPLRQTGWIVCSGVVTESHYKSVENHNTSPVVNPMFAMQGIFGHFLSDITVCEVNENNYTGKAYGKNDLL